MQVTASNFKAYDIRGIVGKTIDEAFAEHLGRAFGSEALGRGRKGRGGGARRACCRAPGLAKALIRGLASTGLDVVDIGMVTTPILYYVACHARASTAAAAASRSPAATTRRTTTASRWCWRGARSTATRSRSLRQRMEAENYTKGQGRMGAMDVNAEYLARIVDDCKLSRPMKIVVDSGNGVAGATAPGILRALGCEVIELYSEVDGDFPNHHPDPSKPENLVDLIAAVKAHGRRSWAWPLTATVTAWAWSRRKATTSSPTGS